MKSIASRFPSAQHWGWVWSAGFPSTGHWHTGTRVKSHKDDEGTGICVTRGKGERIGFVQLEEDKAQRGCRLNGARFFSVVPRNRTRGNGQKLAHRKFYLNLWRTLLLLWSWVSTGMGSPERLWSAHPLRYLDMTLCNLLWGVWTGESSRGFF